MHIKLSTDPRNYLIAQLRMRVCVCVCGTAGFVIVTSQQVVLMSASSPLSNDV